ncbi:hypothetical protein [Nocardia jiangxiensis]|uniref:hypothetical protein n=1 Tax=Nocardia jiangxiensis TaxID=282685 RepID=UPI0002E2FBE7|nr:hypothetical protein [Nocardia jiangxiensis]
MSDVAVGLSTDTLNDIIGHVYQRQYPQYWRDSTTFTQSGTTYELSWDVVQVPVFDLKSVVDHDALAADVVGDGELAEITRAELLRSVAATYESQVFHLDFPQVKLTLTMNGTPAQDTATVQIAASVDTSGNDLVLEPLSATVSTGYKFPDWVYNDKVVPIMLDAARRLLAGVPVPIPEIDGITLTQPVVVVTADHLVCTANVAGGSLPSQQAESWPDEPFFVVLGPDAVRAVTAIGTRDLEGHTEKPHDETNVGIGTAYYKATITMYDLRVDGQVSDDRTISVAATVTGGGSAGINWILGGSTDGFFDLDLTPDPVATVQLDLDDTKLSAKTTGVNDFDLHLTPTSGDIVSVVLSFVANALSGYISPYVRDALTGLSFDVYTVPTLHVDVDTVRFDATPLNLRLSADDGTVAIGGRLEITDR